LTEAQMPSHSHGVTARTGNSSGQATDGAHAHSITDPGHAHKFLGANNANYSIGSATTYNGDWNNYPVNTTSEKTGISINSNNRAYNQEPYNDNTGTLHNHTITVSETAKGSGTAHENMPPFYVLAFIMRVS